MSRWREFPWERIDRSNGVVVFRDPWVVVSAFAGALFVGVLAVVVLANAGVSVGSLVVFGSMAAFGWLFLVGLLREAVFVTDKGVVLRSWGLGEYVYPYDGIAEVRLTRPGLSGRSRLEFVLVDGVVVDGCPRGSFQMAPKEWHVAVKAEIDLRRASDV